MTAIGAGSCYIVRHLAVNDYALDLSGMVAGPFTDAIPTIYHLWHVRKLPVGNG